MTATTLGLTLLPGAIPPECRHAYKEMAPSSHLCESQLLSVKGEICMRTVYY